jgi:succinate dehydrogenase / fumarate reductase, cytochrome b subunit
MAQLERPMSPHIQIYRWKHTFFSLSVWHRASGVIMSVGIGLLVYWLAAAAAGSESYDQALRCLSSPITKIAMFGWLLAFFYHLLNGIRHLGWDLGYGFEKALARKTGTLVLVVSVVLTVLTWLCIASRITATAGGLV